MTGSDVTNKYQRRNHTIIVLKLNFRISARLSISVVITYVIVLFTNKDFIVCFVYISAAH